MDDDPVKPWQPAARSPREWFTVSSVAFVLAGVFAGIRFSGDGGTVLVPAALVVFGGFYLVQGIRALRSRD